MKKLKKYLQNNKAAIAALLVGPGMALLAYLFDPLAIQNYTEEFILALGLGLPLFIIVCIVIDILRNPNKAR